MLEATTVSYGERDERSKLVGVPLGLKIESCGTEAQCCWRVVHNQSKYVLGTLRSAEAANRAVGLLDGINWSGKIRGLLSLKDVQQKLRKLHA